MDDVTLTDRLLTLQPRINSHQLLEELEVTEHASRFYARARKPSEFQRLAILDVLSEEASVQQRADFISGFRLTGAFSHPHVWMPREIVEDNELCYAISDHVPGGSLTQLVLFTRRSGMQLPVAVALQIVLDVMTGLEAIRACRRGSQQSFHLPLDRLSRDRVFVGLDGLSRLTRLGDVLSRFSQKENDSPSGESEARAVGTLLWELLSGRPAAGTREKDESIPSIWSVRPDIAPALEEVIGRATSGDPDLRYPDCDGLLAALHDVIPRLDLYPSHRQVAALAKEAFGAEMERQAGLASEILDEEDSVTTRQVDIRAEVVRQSLLKTLPPKGRAADNHTDPITHRMAAAADHATANDGEPKTADTRVDCPSPRDVTEESTTRRTQSVMARMINAARERYRQLDRYTRDTDTLDLSEATVTSFEGLPRSADSDEADAEEHAVAGPMFPGNDFPEHDTGDTERSFSQVSSMPPMLATASSKRPPGVRHWTLSVPVFLLSFILATAGFLVLRGDPGAESNSDSTTAANSLQNEAISTEESETVAPTEAASEAPSEAEPPVSDTKQMAEQEESAEEVRDKSRVVGISPESLPAANDFRRRPRQIDPILTLPTLPPEKAGESDKPAGRSSFAGISSGLTMNGDVASSTLTVDEENEAPAPTTRKKTKKRAAFVDRWVKKQKSR